MLDAALKELKLHGIALGAETGEQIEASGTSDTETLCAVASVCAAQLQDIGDLLSAGALSRWYVVTEQQAYYVSERGAKRLVGTGPALKNAEATSKALHRTQR